MRGAAGRALLTASDDADPAPMGAAALPGDALPKKPGKAVQWGRLPGGGRGMALSSLAHQGGRPWLVVAPDDATARACFEDCRYCSSLPQDRVLYFPDTEALPYDPEPVAPSIVRDRAIALQKLSSWEDQPGLVITTAAAVCRRMAGPSHWIDSALSLEADDKVDRAELVGKLEALGYQDRPKVRYPGDFSAHPQVVDIYTLGEQGCLRVRFKGNKIIRIEALRPDTQRTTGQAFKELKCLPAREVPIDENALGRLTRNWRSHFGRSLSDPVFAHITSGMKTGPVEDFLPLIAEETTDLYSWLPENSGLYFLPGTWKAVGEFLQRTEQRFAELQGLEGQRLLPPSRLWLTSEEVLRERTARYVVDEIDGGLSLDLEFTGLQRQATLDQALEVLTPLMESSSRIILCVQTEARADSMSLMAEMLGRPATSHSNIASFLDSDDSVALVRANIDEGFISPSRGLIMLTEAEIFGQSIVPRSESEATSTALDVISDFELLEPGDPLVHVRYGVGRFGGIEIIDAGHPQPYLVMDYAEQARIFVRMEDLDMVMRYQGGDTDNPPFDAVGGPRWIGGLREAMRHAQQAAQQLLVLYEDRAQRKGLPCDKPGYAYERFCRAFAFEETRDQRQAIADTIEDLVSDRPMDRIVSGDVGFGKTEVAMRAAFVAAQSGYQVAIMVPTTLLAQQHYDTFVRRFSEFSFQVDLVTRGKGQKQTIDNLADGVTDIVIGTQRLLQDDVRLSRLGLLIIDEEHRFGVKDKERLSRLREQTNVLSMTATPIPRTLSLAMHGVRDISIMSTPPAKRLSIRTLVADREKSKIIEALDREMARGGQAFYLHNRVKTLAETRDQISEWLPNARVEYAHGQMSDQALESVMRRFHEREFDILVCTTIIEIGIDIPNANTMIVEDADQFGLAQLHQLRGRVGRSRRQAYCYLLRSDKAGSEVSQRRLGAMQRASGLGEGLLLAQHDLEIRGAGEILGESQAGDIHVIGFQLYLKILQQAVQSARSGSSGQELVISDSRFDLPFEGFLPEEYIDKPAIQLSLLSRLSRLTHPGQVPAFYEEIHDRFGPLPPPVERLLDDASIRFPLRAAGIERLALVAPGELRIQINFAAHAVQSYFQACAHKEPDVFREIDLFTYEVAFEGDLADWLDGLLEDWDEQGIINSG